MTEPQENIRYVRQLRRLETLMDVVFGLVIWRLFLLFPRPADDETRSVWEVISSDPSAVLTLVIGIAIVIIYWNQNNLLFGFLQRTDGRHTALAIIQLFCLLLFLYAISVGTNYDAATDTRLFESTTALMVGVPAYFGWRHAKRTGKLLSPELSDEEADEISVQILAEPITAAITIPFAIFTPLLWEASWFSYPIVSKFLEKRKEKL